MKTFKKLKSMVDPQKFPKYAGIAIVAGSMAGALAAILRNAF